MQCLERGERPAPPCALSNPRRIFEHPAERLDERGAIRCIQRRERHLRFNGFIGFIGFNRFIRFFGFAL
jgi:hypothetical protein